MLSGSMTFAGTLNALLGTPAPFIYTLPNGEKIFMLMGPPSPDAPDVPATDFGALSQFFNSAVQFNRLLGAIGSGASNSATRDFGQRLYRNRSRFEPNGGSVTSTLDQSFSREVVAAKFRRFEEHLNGSASINLNGHTSATSSSVSSAPIISDANPFLSIEQPAGAYAPGTLAAGHNWLVFAGADFGDASIDSIGSTPGVTSATQSTYVGFEYSVNDHLALGAGWSYLWNDNTLTGGLGSIDVEGNTAVFYATWFQNNFWADLLYAYSDFENDIQRNTGLGTAVTGAPGTESHQGQLNLGYNMGIDGGRVVHGPTFGMTYTDGTIDGYVESGDPRSNTAYGAQDYESFITRLGYQVTWKVDSEIGTLRPQTRIAYGRENLNQNQAVNAVLIPSAANNNTLAGFSGNSVSPGEGWMELGAGLGIDVTANCSIIFDFETQLFRQNTSVHYGSVFAELKF